MSQGGSDTRNHTLAILLGLALIFGICLAWSPGFWAVFTAQGGVLLVAMYLVAVERNLHRSREWIVVALVSAWGVLQISSGRTISPWWTMRASTTWIAAGMGFFVASQVLRRRGTRETFLSIILWSATVLALLAILQIYLDPGRVFALFPAQPGSVGTFLYKNQFAAMLEIAAPIALYRMLFFPASRYAGVAAFTVLLAAGIASVSRAGVVLLTAELAAALIVAVRLRMLNRRNCLKIVALVVLVLGVGVAIGGPQALWDHFQEKDPYGVRHELLKATLRMVADRPWNGFGMGTFHVAYPAYARFDPGVFVNAAHNDWAEWASEGGFPFAILIAALLSMVGARAVKSVWGIGMLAVALHSLVDYPAREPAIALMWFAMIGALTARSANSAAFGHRPA